MKAKKRLRTQFNKYQRFGMVIPGLIGNHTYTIDVPGRPNYIYVRTSDGDVPEVFNNRVTPILDLPVSVGYDPREPQLLQVLSVRSGHARYGDQGAVQPGTPEHHESHEWFANPGGNDVVFSQLRQFMPLRPTPLSTGVAVDIYRSVGYIGGNWLLFTGITFDLGYLVPPTGATFALIYEDTDGLPDAITGVCRDNGEDQLLTDIPQPIPGTLPIAVARLYAGQTRIYETRNYTDLIDLRFPMWHDHSQYITGSAGVSSFLLLTDTPSSYSGESGSVASVNSLENALEFRNAVNISSGDANIASVNFLEQGSDPNVPSPNHRVLYAKGDGIYEKDALGNVIGPFCANCEKTLLIYDDSTFKVTGSAISFDDQLDISVTGSIAYVNVVDTIPWTDHSSISVVIGWSPLTVKEIFYERKRDLVFLRYYFDGTSVTGTAAFTLPYTANGLYGDTIPRLWDNGIDMTTPGLGVITNGSTLLTFYKTSDPATAWTASGNKGMYGTFWYRTAQGA